MIAYWFPACTPSLESLPPQLDALREAGPWVCSRHPQGGTLATWRDWPEAGQFAPRVPEAYGDPVEVEPGMHYLPPKTAPTPATIYDLAKDTPGGVDLTLACGLAITIPCALVAARQFSLSGRGRGYVNEYGRLAHELLLDAQQPGDDGKPRGLDLGDPRVHRLFVLAVGQRYRVTAHLLDDLNLIAVDDVEPLLDVIWSGDPKASRPDGDAGPQPSPSSASTA